MWRNTVGVIVILALGIIFWAPFAAHAQSPAKMPRIGYLTLHAGPTAEYEAFTQGLRDLGWIEGRTIAIESRWAAGQVERLPALAAELVGLQVDCIAALATPAAQAAKDATQSIPIVMIWVGDPVRTGLVASLARPGGNVTGTAGLGPELAGKHLERLRDLLPTLSRVAFLAYAGDPIHQLFLQEAQDAAARLGIQVQPLVLGSVEEIEHAFMAMRSAQAEALMVQPLFVGPLGQGQRIADLAVQHRVPTISTPRGFTEAGGLMSYGPDPLALPRRSAAFVDKIQIHVDIVLGRASSAPVRLDLQLSICLTARGFRIARAGRLGLKRAFEIPILLMPLRYAILQPGKAQCPPGFLLLGR